MEKTTKYEQKNFCLITMSTYKNYKNKFKFHKNFPF